MSNDFLERRIIIGMITNTDYLTQIRDVYQSKLLSSSMAKRLATWCIEYFDKYGKAPGKYIEDIYFQKLKAGLPKDIAEEISQDILPGLSDEYVQSKEELIPLVADTRSFFVAQSLIDHAQKIQSLIESGEVGAAQALANNFKGIMPDEDSTLSFDEVNALRALKIAFQEAEKPLLHFPRALGEFWDDQFIPGGLIGIMASEKRGKTFLLMYIARLAVRQGLKVAFFQAGDMTQNQQLRRFAINLTKISDKEKYCGKMYEGRLDCLHNQLDTCNRPDRECEFGVFTKFTEKDIRKQVTQEDLIEALKENPKYKPCYNCAEFKTNKWGTIWLEELFIDGPLTYQEAKKAWKKYYFGPAKGKIRLSTHSNGTLTNSIIKSKLNFWEKKHNFIPDIILVDYADLLEDEGKDERSKQNKVWKGLRSISQEERGGKMPLVIAPTQADANSYEIHTIKLKNFSEDKRKYAHVTAMYGLNQDPDGRERKLGIMRINEIVIREGELDAGTGVHIIQNLKRGQPYLASYF